MNIRAIKAELWEADSFENEGGIETWILEDEELVLWLKFEWVSKIVPAAGDEDLDDRVVLILEEVTM